MFTKDMDPSDDEQLGICWAAWLDSGEAIASSAWIVSPAGPTLHDAVMNVSLPDGVSNTVFIGGLVADKTYVLTNIVETNSTPPRKSRRSIRINSREG